MKVKVKGKVVAMVDGFSLRLQRAALMHTAMRDELAQVIAATRYQLRRYVLEVSEFEAEVSHRRIQMRRLALDARRVLARR